MSVGGVKARAAIGALEMKHNTLLGNCDRPTDQRTDRQTGS